MKIISIANTKGGTGKTTTTANLGAGLASAGKKVLLIDYDPQCSLTDFFMVDAESDGALSIKDAILNKTLHPKETIINLGKNLDLIPCHFELRALELPFQQKHFGGTGALKTVVDKISSNYDYVLIDTPATESIFMVQAGFASTDVLITIKASDIDIKATARFLDTLDIAIEDNPKLKVSGIVFTMFKKGSKFQSIFSENSFNGDALQTKVMKTKIRDTVGLATSSIKGQTIFDTQPKGIGAEDYRQLTQEVMSWS